MNKAVITLFFTIFIIHLIVPNTLAENITQPHTNLTAPMEYNITFGCNNDTILWPINCMLNETNATMPDLNCTKCDTTRTLNHGERYLKEDNFCKLDFMCPVCECESCENITRKWRYRIYTENERVYVVSLIDNETRSYSKGENFDITDEFKIDCPTLEDYEDELQKKIEEWKPINITQEQWYWLCLEPFGQYGKTLEKLTTSTTEFQRKLIQDISSLSESNKQLSEENGKLKEQQAQFIENKEKLQNCEYEKDRAKKELEECRSENNTVKTSSGIKNFFFWVLLFINIVLGLALIMRWRYNTVLESIERGK